MRNPTYLYHPSEEPRVFDLAPGEALPDGWHDKPVPRVESAPASNDEIVAARAEVARLQDVIATGMAENERLADELEAKEDELEAAAKAIADAGDADTVRAEAETLRAKVAELEGEKARLEKVVEDLEADVRALKPKKPAAK
jgi:chromosome segregation ATPase